MKVYGQLEKAQVEQLASDPGSPVKGQIWFNTTDNVYRFYDGTNTKAVSVEVLASDPGSPYEGQVWYNSTTKEFKYYDGTATLPLGSGSGGGLDVYYSEQFRAVGATDFSTGNNASFLGGGTLDGVLSDEETSPLSDLRSIKYVAGTTSLNDYIASPVIDLDLKQRGNDSGLTLYFTFDGSTNIEVVVYDVTNGAKLNSTLDVISTQTNSTRYSASFFVPTSCTQIRYGFHILEAPTSGDILLFDDVELSTDPFVYKDLVEYGSGIWTGQAGYGSTATRSPYYTNEQENTLSKFGTIKNNSTDGWSFTANRVCKVVISGSFEISTGPGNVGFSKNATTLSTPLLSLPAGEAVGTTWSSANEEGNVTFSGVLQPGDVIRPHTDGGTLGPSNDQEQVLTISVQAQASHVLAPIESTLSDWVDGGPISIGATTTAPTKGTTVFDSFKWRRVGDTMEIQIDYYQSGGGSSGSGEYLFDINSVTGYSVDTSKLRVGGGVNNLNAEVVGHARVMNTNLENTSSVSLGRVLYDSGDNFKIAGLPGTVSQNYIIGSSNFGLAGALWYSLNFKVPIAEWSSAGKFLGAIPKNYTQTKYLSADRTEANNNTDIGDFQFNNLTIGKWYSVSGKLLITDAGGGIQLFYRSAASNAGTQYERYVSNNEISTTGSATRYVNFKFKAASSSMYVYQTGTSVNTDILGDGTSTESYLQLTELNYTEETTRFS